MRVLGCCVLSLSSLYFSNAAICDLFAQAVSETPLAWVGQEPVTVAQMNLYLGRQGSDLAELPHAVQQVTVHLIAQQRQALQTLRKRNLSAMQEEVDRAIEGESQSGDTPDEVAEKLAKTFGVRIRDIRDLFEFRLAWKRYLAKHVTETNMQKHFDQQKARFDGTKFKIAMASLPVPVGSNKARQAAHKKLSELAASSAVESGEAPLDAWVSRAQQSGCEVQSEHEVRGVGDLDHAAIDVLLQLGDGEMSGPLDTASGVHVIWLLSKTAGQRELSSAKDEVRAHMLVYLLEHLAAQSREQLPLTSL